MWIEKYIFYACVLRSYLLQKETNGGGSLRLQCMIHALRLMVNYKNYIHALSAV